MQKETKIFLTIGAMFFGAVAAVGYNAALATTESVGEPHSVSFTYCAEQHYGAKSTSWCGRTAVGHETRQDTINHGPLFDFEGYKVVR